MCGFVALAPRSPASPFHPHAGNPLIHPIPSHHTTLLTHLPHISQPSIPLVRFDSHQHGISHCIGIPPLLAISRREGPTAVLIIHSISRHIQSLSGKRQTRQLVGRTGVENINQSGLPPSHLQSTLQHHQHHHHLLTPLISTFRPFAAYGTSRCIGSKERVGFESNGWKNRSERCRSEEEGKDVNQVTGRDCVGLAANVDSGDLLRNERRGGRGESSGFIWICLWSTRSRCRSWSRSERFRRHRTLPVVHLRPIACARRT